MGENVTVTKTKEAVHIVTMAATGNVWTVIRAQLRESVSRAGYVGDAYILELQYALDELDFSG